MEIKMTMQIEGELESGAGAPEAADAVLEALVGVHAELARAEEIRQALEALAETLGELMVASAHRDVAPGAPHGVPAAAPDDEPDGEPWRVPAALRTGAEEGIEDAVPADAASGAPAALPAGYRLEMGANQAVTVMVTGRDAGENIASADVLAGSKALRLRVLGRDPEGRISSAEVRLLTTH